MDACSIPRSYLQWKKANDTLVRDPPPKYKFQGTYFRLNLLVACHQET